MILATRYLGTFLLLLVYEIVVVLLCTTTLQHVKGAKIQSGMGEGQGKGEKEVKRVTLLRHCPTFSAPPSKTRTWVIGHDTYRGIALGPDGYGKIAASLARERSYDRPYMRERVRACHALQQRFGGNRIGSKSCFDFWARSIGRGIQVTEEAAESTQFGTRRTSSCSPFARRRDFRQALQTKFIPNVAPPESFSFSP